MKCPFCGNNDTQVKDSRATEDNSAIRRRRFCSACGLERSVQIALRKRPVDNERVDRMISGIVRRVESLGETEVSSDVIGEIVMEGLQSIDSVAYVRFASVYKNFREAKDFEEFLGVISSTED